MWPHSGCRQHRGPGVATGPHLADKEVGLSEVSGPLPALPPHTVGGGLTCGGAAGRARSCPCVHTRIPSLAR